MANDWELGKLEVSDMTWIEKFMICRVPEKPIRGSESIRICQGSEENPSIIFLTLSEIDEMIYNLQTAKHQLQS